MLLNHTYHFSIYFERIPHFEKDKWQKHKNLTVRIQQKNNGIFKINIESMGEKQICGF